MPNINEDLELDVVDTRPIVYKRGPFEYDVYLQVANYEEELLHILELCGVIAGIDIDLEKRMGETIHMRIYADRVPDTGLYTFLRYGFYDEDGRHFYLMSITNPAMVSIEDEDVEEDWIEIAKEIDALCGIDVCSDWLALDNEVEEDLDLDIVDSPLAFKSRPYQGPRETTIYKLESPELRELIIQDLEARKESRTDREDKLNCDRILKRFEDYNSDEYDWKMYIWPQHKQGWLNIYHNGDRVYGGIGFGYNPSDDVIKQIIDVGIEESLVEKIVKKGNKWQVQSEKGRNMGTYDTKADAEKRLQQVHYFKHKNEDLELEITEIPPAVILEKMEWLLDYCFLDETAFILGDYLFDCERNYLHTIYTIKDEKVYALESGELFDSLSDIIKEDEDNRYNKLEEYLPQLDNSSDFKLAKPSNWEDWLVGIVYGVAINGGDNWKDFDNEIIIDINNKLDINIPLREDLDLDTGEPLELISTEDVLSKDGIRIGEKTVLKGARKDLLYTLMAGEEHDMSKLEPFFNDPNYDVEVIKYLSGNSYVNFKDLRTGFYDASAVEFNLFGIFITEDIYAAVTSTDIDEELDLETVDAPDDSWKQYHCQDDMEYSVPIHTAEYLINRYFNEHCWYFAQYSKTLKRWLEGSMEDIPDKSLNGFMTFDEAYFKFLDKDLDEGDRLVLCYFLRAKDVDDEDAQDANNHYGSLMILAKGDSDWQDDYYLFENTNEDLDLDIEDPIEYDESYLVKSRNYDPKELIEEYAMEERWFLLVQSIEGWWYDGTEDELDPKYCGSGTFEEMYSKFEDYVVRDDASRLYLVVFAEDRNEYKVMVKYNIDIREDLELDIADIPDYASNKDIHSFNLPLAADDVINQYYAQEVWTLDAEIVGAAGRSAVSTFSGWNNDLPEGYNGWFDFKTGYEKLLSYKNPYKQGEILHLCCRYVSDERTGYESIYSVLYRYVDPEPVVFNLDIAKGIFKEDLELDTESMITPTLYIKAVNEAAKNIEGFCGLGTFLKDYIIDNLEDVCEKQMYSDELDFNAIRDKLEDVYSDTWLYGSSKISDDSPFRNMKYQLVTGNSGGTAESVQLTLNSKFDNVLFNSDIKVVESPDEKKEETNEDLDLDVGSLEDIDVYNKEVIGEFLANQGQEVSIIGNTVFEGAPGLIGIEDDDGTYYYPGRDTAYVCKNGEILAKSPFEMPTSKDEVELWQKIFKSEISEEEALKTFGAYEKNHASLDELMYALANLWGYSKEEIENEYLYN